MRPGIRPLCRPEKWADSRVAAPVTIPGHGISSLNRLPNWIANSRLASDQKAGGASPGCDVALPRDLVVKAEDHARPVHLLVLPRHAQDRLAAEILREGNVPSHVPPLRVRYAAVYHGGRVVVDEFQHIEAGASLFGCLAQEPRAAYCETMAFLAFTLVVVEENGFERYPEFNQLLVRGRRSF